MINKVILIGNVGNDPEYKSIYQEAEVVKFSLATSESYKDKQGEKVTNTEWHNVTAWGRLADIVDQYVKKGMRLYIEGKIRYNKYEKDGETKYFTEIEASSIRMLGSKENNHQNQQSTQAHTSQPNTDFADDTGDDLPF